MEMAHQSGRWHFNPGIPSHLVKQGRGHGFNSLTGKSNQWDVAFNRDTLAAEGDGQARVLLAVKSRALGDEGVHL